MLKGIVMTKAELLKIPKIIDSKGRVNANTVRTTSKHYDDIITIVSPFVKKHNLQNYKLSAVIMIIINDIAITNHCMICGKQTTLDTVKKEFRKFCSNKCSNDPKSTKFEKIKQTNLNKYGDTHTFNHTKTIREQTNLKRYGTKTPASSPEIREKIKQTNIERYGYDNPAKSQLVIDKIRDSHNKMFGNKYYTQQHMSESLLEKLSNVEFCKQICDDKSKTFTQYADDLQITPKTLLSYIRKHDLKITRKPVSKIESYIADYLISQNVYFETNNRDVIERELDIWIPEYNLAIELNGIYWHSDLIDPRNKHTSKDKFKMCSDKNIRLLTFFEHEIENKFDLVTGMISHCLGKYETKIYARKLKFVKLQHSDKQVFMNENHLMGDVKTKINYGLKTSSGELVAAISFIHDRFNKGPDTFEIARFAIKNGYHIPGGFSKLLVNSCKEEDFESLLTYANLRFGNADNVYSRYGFEFVSFSKPGYMYAKQTGRGTYDVISRNKAVRSNLTTLLKHYDNTQSQYDNMTNNGWLRIWDCGNAKYIWKNNGKN